MIRLEDAIILKNSIEAISSFISEGNLRFSDSGIFFRAIDPSQVVLIDYFLPKNAFTLYKVEPNLVGIDLIELNKVFQRILPSDIIELDLLESELKIKLIGEIERVFFIPLIDISEEEIKLPSITYSVAVNINSKLLKELLRDASLFSSSVVIRARSGKLLIEAQGSQGNLKCELSNSDGIKVKGKLDVASKYSLSFLLNIIKEAPNDLIGLSLKTDAAMKIEYSIGKASIKYYLAHMIL